MRNGLKFFRGLRVKFNGLRIQFAETTMNFDLPGGLGVFVNLAIEAREQGIRQRRSAFRPKFQHCSQDFSRITAHDVMILRFDGLRWEAGSMNWLTTT